MSDWTERPEYTPVPAALPEDADMPLAHHAAVQAEEAGAVGGLEQKPASDGALDADGGTMGEAAAAVRCAAAPVRALNEDDDGYDPYSDWHDQGSSSPLFERDPWE